MELAEGKNLREVLATGPLPTRRARRDRRADRERARAGARGRDRSPGPETRERDGVRGRPRQDRRLRAGEVAALRGRRRRRAGDADDGDGGGNRARHGRLHVAGAGRGASPWISGPISSRSARSCTRWSTGQAGLRGQTKPETLAAIIREEPEPIETINPRVPAPLRWIVERCHAKEPKNRYASTEDLARDLAAAAGAPVGGRRPRLWARGRPAAARPGPLGRRRGGPPRHWPPRKPRREPQPRTGRASAIPPI